jgi:chromate transporter
VISPLDYFLVFLKASFFSVGGLSSLPSLRQDLIARNWAAPPDFGEAVAVGQISSGPNGLWVVSLGYLTYGYLGAVLALIAITLPPFLVLPRVALLRRVGRRPWMPHVINGVFIAVLGLLLAAAWSTISTSGADWKGWLIGAGALVLAGSRRVNPAVVLVLAGAIGGVVYR